MNKVDELIEKLAEHITELIDKGYEEDIFDDTRALAELITARAHADKENEMDTEIINFLIALTDMQMKLYLKEYEPNNLYQRTLRTLYDMLPDEEKKKVPESIRATITEKGLKEWLNRGKAVK